MTGEPRRRRDNGVARNCQHRLDVESPSRQEAEENIMKKTRSNGWTHKGWTIYKAGPFPGSPKKYVLFPPDGFPGDRFEEPSLERAGRFIIGLLALEAFNARVKKEAEWIEIDK